MKNISYFLGVFLPILIHALDVDIVTNFNIEELPSQLLSVKQVFDIKTVSLSDYFTCKSPTDPNLSKILIFNPYFDSNLISKLPKEKLILFVWEPETLPISFYNEYSRVYIWDDSLIDNEKFFRFNYPYLMPMRENSIPFEEKKLCTMVVGNWTKERLDILAFFESNYSKELDCYGRCQPRYTLLWKGPISGPHSGSEKIETLQKYRFCICFENTIGLKGYITEKIFSCFAAGCIPIYWGAENIEDYIPKDCFIDYRDFESHEQLYQFLVNMSSARHQEYVKAIDNYLCSEQAQIFSPGSFDDLVYEAITQ